MTASTKDFLSDAPCRSCEGCTNPFECKQYMDWVFEDIITAMQEVTRIVWERNNADKS